MIRSGIRDPVGRNLSAHGPPSWRSLMAPHTRREFLVAGLAVAACAAVPASGQSSDLATLTLRQAVDLVRRRKVSAVELTEACLRRIDAYNPTLNAFVTVAREQAFENARQLDAE